MGEGSMDLPGLGARQMLEIEINALRSQAAEFDETERVKASAFAGYQPQTGWLAEKLQEMYPGRELPAIENCESATAYVDRVTESLITGMEEQ